MTIASFQCVKYEHMNACQKEIFNFQKVSSVLADFGIATYRLTDDWNGADFLAVHFDGMQFLRAQLKGRLAVGKKYQGKNLWVCFRHLGFVYLHLHDEALLEVLKSDPSWHNQVVA